ncbi:hypothetical protein LC1Nh_0310 [Candidatus Nanohalobium constans]|uniref:Uncharacterized protein n=2 Tax=Candidatus Nanohalobium constans TaxID=2565781 RepID=A0A5Q0UF35_9ARCH|nr:hypothetical protein LC1Nh_0310 [Candidatus Nanohalobium constans]
MVIGVVGALAGSSTMALFNDSETSADNSFQAGELDLKVDWEESYNGEHVETQELTNDPGAIFDFKDIKPGDHGEATVSLHLKDNPGWIWMNINETSNWDNSCTEPEHEAEGSCGSKGELQDKLEFVIWSDDGDNVRQDDENIIFEGTADELREEKGVLLDGNPSTDDKEAFPGSETGYIGVKWKVPLETGNIIQGDSVNYDIKFYTEQRRHNDNPSNPWTDDKEEGNESDGDNGDDSEKPDEPENPEEPEEPEEPENPEDPQNPEDPEDPKDNETDYTANQGDKEVEISPISGNKTVEELYDFRLPDRFDHDNQAQNGATYPEDGPYYQSAGTENLQQQETSIMFLYDGPDGLSFVVVHDKAGGDGGSATWEITGLNESGNWVVKDDLYLSSNGEKASTNYDNWDVNSSTQTIDWTWGSGGTDGGAFKPLDENFSFTIDPAFNEDSELYEEFYDGEIDNWQVLSGDMNNPDRTNLDLTEEVTLQAQ